MHDRGARDNYRYLKLVRANAVLSDENEDRAKTGEGKAKGERGARAGVEERSKERCRVLSPWLPGTAGCA